MVGPVQGGSQPPVSGPSGAGSGSGSGGSTTEQIFTDTLSDLVFRNRDLVIFSANNPQITKPSLFSVLQQVSLASIDNKQQAYDMSVAIYLLSSKFYGDMAINAQRLLNLVEELRDLQTELVGLSDDINDDIDDENAKISSYNSGIEEDTSQTTDIHDAANTFNDAYDEYQTQTERFNNGEITPQQYAQAQATFDSAEDTYNNAVASYNGYVNSRTTVINDYNNSRVPFNEQADHYNETIDHINQYRGALGLPNLPEIPHVNATALSLSPAETTPPAPVNVPPIVNPGPIPKIPPFPTISEDNLVTGIFIPQTQTATAPNAYIVKSLDIVQKAREYADFFLQTKTAIFALPPAFASYMAASGTTFTGINSNASLASIAGTLDPVIVSRLFNQGAQNAYYDAFSSVLKPGTIDIALTATANVLAGASLVSAQELIQKLVDSQKGVGIDESARDDAFSLELALNIFNIASNNTLATALRDLASPEVRSDPAFETTLTALTSSINLSLAATALELLSSTLNLPGLGAQLLGLAGLSKSDLFNLTSTNGGVGFNTLAFNPFSQPVFAELLATQLTQMLGLVTGSKEANAIQLQQDIQNSLLTAATQTSPLAQQNAFFINLARTLNEFPTTRPLAPDILAAASTAFFQPAFTSRVDFRNTLQQSLINQGFNEADAILIASSLTGVPPLVTSDEPLSTSNIDIDLFITNLAFLLRKEIESPDDIAAKVILAFVKNRQEVAEATFRDDLRHQLVKQELDEDRARRIATQITIPVNTLDDPLKSSITTNVLASSQIQDGLAAAIFAVYSPLFGPERAREESRLLAQKITDETNPLSPVRTLQDNLNKLKDNQDQIYFETAVDSLKNYLEPSVELYALMERVRDPGQRLLFVNDLMFAPKATTGPLGMGGTNPPLEIAV